MQGLPMDEICKIAAEAGHIYVLEYARLHQMDWSAQTCANAARENQLATLIWLRERMSLE